MSYTDEGYEPIVDDYDEDNGREGAILECPDCQYSSSIENWNKSIRKFSARIGAAIEIPEGLDREEIEQFILDNGGRADCPVCGQHQNLCDLEIH